MATSATGSSRRLGDAGQGARNRVVEPSASWLRKRVLNWSTENRRDFAWRRSRRPYDILLAELLLHRTRADVVEPLFLQLRRRYPTPARLAEAKVEEVEELLRPLGFAHRARRLPSLGRALRDRYGGEVPATEEELKSLPGVGRYIANAVLAVAFGRPAPLLDPNVIRVLERVFDERSTRSRPREDPALWAFLGRLVPRSQPGDFGLALVDLGALVCTVRRPDCAHCPLRDRCRALRSGRVMPASAVS